MINGAYGVSELQECRRMLVQHRSIFYCAKSYVFGVPGGSKLESS
jgi:hypothetical protein